MKKVYSIEFKKAVVEDYYSSPLGIREIAKKYDLPSKNYITKWEQYLKKMGVLEDSATKPHKTVGRAKEQIIHNIDLTEREKQYESEIRALKAKVEYLEGLKSLQPFLKKTPKSES